MAGSPELVLKNAALADKNGKTTPITKAVKNIFEVLLAKCDILELYYTLNLMSIPIFKSSNIQKFENRGERRNGVRLSPKKSYVNQLLPGGGGDGPEDGFEPPPP